MKLSSVLLLVLSCTTVLAVEDVFSGLRVDDPIVNTTSGPLQGYKSKTWRDDVEYAAFVGVPFAKPPVGPLRFKAPVQNDPWTEVRNATAEQNACYASSLNVLPSEDCLYINVYIPITNETKPKAVMAFTYGGGFNLGSSTSFIYGPGFLLEQDVIFVSYNYRLGPLGFLSLQNDEIPGNAGLKDQVLALKWVQENIKYFGGDPSKVTLFGESAGGASTSFLHLSPSAKGLFRSIITQSGTALSRWADVSPSNSVLHAYRLGDIMECGVNQTQANSKQLLLDCLRNASAMTMSLKQNGAHTAAELELLKVFPFAPTVEPVGTKDAIITKHPWEIIRNSEFNDVDVITGTNNFEALMIYREIQLLDPNGDLTILFGKNLSRFIPEDLVGNVNYTQSAAIHQRIQDFYIGHEVNDTQEDKLRLLDITTDTHWNIENQRLALMLSERSNRSIYNYQMTYDGPFNLLKSVLLLTGFDGVCHADELGYIMDPLFFRPLYQLHGRHGAAHHVIDRFTTMWANFAKTGKPTLEIDGDIITTEWKPFTPTQHNYMEISAELTLKQGLNSERMKFWNDIYQYVRNERPIPE